MIRNNRLGKLASDRAICGQKHLLRSKLGPRYRPVANQRPGIGGNSQTCICGALVSKTLKDRVLACPACGLVADRDTVSANITPLIAFGSVSLNVDGIHRLTPASGQEVERRGGTEAAQGESTGGEPHPATGAALEAPMKHRSQADRSGRSTAGGEPTAAGKTRAHRNGGVLPPLRCRVRLKPSPHKNEKPIMDVRGCRVINLGVGQVTTVQVLLVNPAEAKVQSIRLNDGVVYDVDDVRIDMGKKQVVLRTYDEIAHDVRGNQLGPADDLPIEVDCQESALATGTQASGL